MYIDSVGLGNGTAACRYLASHLKGDALTWWRTYTYENTDWQNDLTLSEMVTELGNEFCDVDREMKLRDKILGLKQYSDFQQYVSLFRKLQLELGSGKLDDNVAMHVFIQGLKPDTRQHVLLQRPADLQLAIQLAGRAEEVMRYNQNRNGGSRGGFRGGNNGGFRGGNNGGFRGNGNGSSRGGYRGSNNGGHRGGFGKGNNGISQYGDHSYKGYAPMVLGTAQRGGFSGRGNGQHGGSNSGQRPNVQCFFCGKQGHYKKDCYKFLNQQGGGNKSGDKGKQLNNVTMDVSADVAKVISNGGASSSNAQQQQNVRLNNVSAITLADGSVICTKSGKLLGNANSSKN